MNLLIVSGTDQTQGKALLNATSISDAVSTATSLGYNTYNIRNMVQTVIVNHNNGVGYNIGLTSNGTNVLLFIFDTSESSVLNYLTTNYPNSTLLNFAKTSYTLA